MVVGIEGQMFSAGLQAKVGGQCPVRAQGPWALPSKDCLSIKALHGPCPPEPCGDLQRTHRATGF